MNAPEIEQVVREYIKKTVHMSLGTAKDNQPWVCEVHFAHDDDLNLYFVSKLATRHCQEIAANPHVAGNIIAQHSLSEAPNGIYFEGTAEKIAASAQDITRYCQALQRDEAQLAEWLAEKDGRCMYKISVANWAMFGNFDGNGMAKSELEWGK